MYMTVNFHYSLVLERLRKEVLGEYSSVSDPRNYEEHSVHSKSGFSNCFSQKCVIFFLIRYEIFLSCGTR